MINVWSFGGGTQSTAIAALVIQGRLPKPDFAIIADTGRETRTTWDYLEKVTGPALLAFGIQLHRVSANDFGYNGMGLFNRSDTLLIPAFTSLGEDGGKLSGYCSRWWKSDVAENYLSRAHGITRSKFCSWIGYGKDEQIRWARCMRGDDYKAGRIRLPLVIDVPLSRHECQKLIESMGWPVPAPKSRCWMCPNQSDSEWRSLPRDEFQKAVQLEKEIQRTDPHAWLHKSMIPLSDVDFTQPDDLFNRPCDSGNCFL